MSKEIFLLLEFLLIVASIGLLVLTLGMPARIHYVVQERLRDLLDIDSDTVDNSLAHKVGRWFDRFGLRHVNIATLRSLLDHAGIYRPEWRALVHGAYVLSPFLFSVLAAVYTLAAGSFAEKGIYALMTGAVFGYFAPRYVLRYMVNLRKRRLRDEALMMIHLLKMLFDAGLSIEQALRILRDQAGILLPHMCHDLDRMIKRIETGMDRASVLDKWAGEAGVREVSDLAEMLLQLSRQGGNIQESLTEMVALMEDRNRTALREKVGKLSGKMTVVMVLFLFPALMIFVAGPGVISITGALGGLR